MAEKKIALISFSPKRNNLACLLSVALLLLMLGCFVLPTARLSGVWGTGHTGAAGAMTANVARSYRQAPLELASLIPAIYRNPAGEATEPDRYYSHFPVIYIAYALATSVVGTSVIAIRLLAVMVCLAGALLTALLLRKQSNWTMFFGLLLYVTSPLTFLYGNMAEHYLPIGCCLLLVTWFYGEYIGKRRQLKWLVLASVPLAASSIFMSVFFIAAIFVTQLFLGLGIKKTLRLCSLLTFIWGLFFVFHLFTVYTASGSLDVLFSRSGARGIIAAFTRQENPLNDVLRNWLERLGVPVCLFFALAVRQGFKKSKQSPDKFALLLVAFITCLGFTLAFMQLVAAHRYTMQLFLPLFVFLAAPVFKEFCQSQSRKRKIFGFVVLLVCLGMFGHRIRRWQAPDLYEKSLANFAMIAEKILKKDEPLLMLVDKNIMGAKMSLLYYSRRPVLRILKSELSRINPGDYKFIIGTNVDDLLLVLIKKYKLNPHGFNQLKDKSGKSLGLFYWYEPESFSGLSLGRD